MTHIVAATWTAKPGEAERIAGILKALTDFSRNEDGNVFYQAHAVADAPETFFIYEQYKDAAAFEAHRSSPHFQELVVEGALPHLATREVKICSALEA